MVYYIRSLYIMVLCYNSEFHWISLKAIELCSFAFNMNLTHWSNLVHSISSATSCTNFLRQNISIEVPARTLWKLNNTEFYLHKNHKMKTAKQLRRLTWQVFFFASEWKGHILRAEPVALNAVFKVLHTVRVLCALNKPELKNKRKDIYRHQIREL